MAKNTKTKKTDVVKNNIFNNHWNLECGKTVTEEIRNTFTFGLEHVYSNDADDSGDQGLLFVQYNGRVKQPIEKSLVIILLFAFKTNDSLVLTPFVWSWSGHLKIWRKPATSTRPSPTANLRRFCSCSCWLNCSGIRKTTNIRRTDSTLRVSIFRLVKIGATITMVILMGRRRAKSPRSTTSSWSGLVVPGVSLPIGLLKFTNGR